MYVCVCVGLCDVLGVRYGPVYTCGDNEITRWNWFLFYLCVGSLFSTTAGRLRQQMLSLTEPSPMPSPYFKTKSLTGLEFTRKDRRLSRETLESS